ncbi:MAG: SdrD B-like domain-containing protein, partial [Verrucomicrobiota bacterium]
MGDPLASSDPLTAGASDSLVAFDWDASGFFNDDPANMPIHVATAAETGSIWGIAWSPGTEKIYSAAFLKRHIGLGPGSDGAGTGALGSIYVTNYNGNSSSTSHFITIPSVGTIASNAARGLTATPTDTTEDPDPWGNIAKIGLGDIDISEDEKELFVINLNTKEVVVVDIASASVARTLTIPVPTGMAATSEWRPFALKYYCGQLWVGGVHSEENAGAAADFALTVYQMDPTAGTVSTTVTKNIGMNRGTPTESAWTQGGANPWSDDFATLNAPAPNTDALIYRQLVLADIEFDPSDGAMILGFFDRTGHMSGEGQPGPASENAGQLHRVEAGGELLRLAPDGAGGFDLEENGSVGGRTGANAGNGHGLPDSTGTTWGEFYNDNHQYYDRTTPPHEETSNGGLAINPSQGLLMHTTMDPGAATTGGVGTLRNSDGDFDNSYALFDTDVLGNLGKGIGMGDVEVLCGLNQKFEVGNRIWHDVNGNGVQDPGEEALSGVQVALWGDTDSDGVIDTQIGDGTSDGSGNYTFGGPADANMFADGTTETVTYTTKVVYGDNDMIENTTGDVSDPNGITMTDGYVTGLRFVDVCIPPGATVTNAYIAVDGLSGTGVATSTITGELIADAPALSTAKNDISARTDTAASVAWGIPDWPGTAVDYQSPDISAIIQEILGTGWEEGNAMVIKLAHSGASRDMETAGGIEPLTGAILIVEYEIVGYYCLLPGVSYDLRVPVTDPNLPTGAVPTAANYGFDAGQTDAHDSDGDNEALNAGFATVRFTTSNLYANKHTYDFGFGCPFDLALAKTSATPSTIEPGDDV